MSKEVTTPSEAKWTIDLKWLDTNKRDFSVLAKDALCAKCRKKLKADTTEPKPADILKAVQSCCSKTDNFITPGLPLQESIFRVLIANGNKPMTVEVLGTELNKRCGTDAHRTSAAFLGRILQNDDYYGIKEK
jgi:hypothetical protein